MAALPKQLKEYEQSDAVRWGVWTLDASGRRYVGNWDGADAQADLVVEKFDGYNIIIQRTDRTGSSYGLTARYEGIWDSAISRFRGSVAWTWQGSTWSGTWQAYPASTLTTGSSTGTATASKGSSAPRISGQWNSDFGPVTLEEIPTAGGKSTVRGYWIQSSDKTGEIKYGAFDPATGDLEFTYYEPWVDVTGSARFKLSTDGHTLQGTWAQPASQKLQAMSGAWVMRR